MKKRMVCILFGGKSGEHEVSLKSAASVAKHLDRVKYGIILIGIEKGGKWYLQNEGHFTQIPGQGEALAIEELDKPVSVVPGDGIHQNNQRLDIDVVFPVLHGTYGEDGTVQGLLEIAGLPYVGAGVLGSSLAMDKEKTKKIWIEACLPVVNFIVIRDTSRSSLKRIKEAFPFPVFVKPAAAGSSVGITKVHSAKELLPALKDAFRFDIKVLVEPSITGREIECAVLGNALPEAFLPGEIIPVHEFYSYEAKYIDPEGAQLKYPADIPDDIRHRIMNLAVEAFRCAECSGMARVDFFWEDKSDRVYLNEINTIPGFTNISMYPKMCETSGLSYPELLGRLIDLAVERYSRRRALIYSYEKK